MAASSLSARKHNTVYTLSGGTSSTRQRTSTRKGTGRFSTRSLGNVIEDETRPEDSTETDEEEIEYQKQHVELALTPEYMQISKLIRLAKYANQTSTVLGLLALDDLITADNEKIWLLRLAGVQLLVNLLRVDDHRCKTTSLKLLSKATTHKFIIDEVIKLKGVQRLLVMLEEASSSRGNFNKREIQLTLGILGNLSTSRRVRRRIHEYGGFSTLIRFLELDVESILCKMGRQSAFKKKQLSARSTRSVSRAPKLCRRETTTLGKSLLREKETYALQNLHLAAKVLWKLCTNRYNVNILITRHDVTRLLTDLLKLQVIEIDEPIIGLINKCCVYESFCKEALEDNLIFHCVRALRYQDNREMQMNAAQTIRKCVQHVPKTKEELRTLSGLSALMNLIEHAKEQQMTELLKVTLHTFWFSIKENLLSCRWFGKEDYVEKIMELLKHSIEAEVTVYCFGIMKEYMNMCRQDNERLLENHSTQIFLDNLQHTNKSILIAANNALKIASQIPELREDMINNDILRLAWSNLKSKDPKVTATSAEAIHHLIEQTEVIAEIIRSFVGGLELLVKLLNKTDDEKILASTCSVIARVAKDKENQSILDDYGILNVLINLCGTKFDEVKKALCRCFISYGVNEKYRLTLRPTIIDIGTWLHSPQHDVVYEATHALFNLSFNQENCKLMYEIGVVKNLINLIRSQDEGLQEASALCLKNIRITVMANS